MHSDDGGVRKVPTITIGFWIAKVTATTLGETGSDTVTMSLKFGYLKGAALLFVILSILVFIQVRIREFRPLLFWTAIVTSTMFGTAMADFVDRTLGIGFSGGTLLFLMSLGAVLSLVRVARLRICRNGHPSSPPIIFLDGRGGLPDAGNRSGRLVGLCKRFWVRGKRARLHWRSDHHRRQLLLDEPIPRGSVLVSFHFDPTARSNNWRFS
jgi:Repeat of Unknown Function (DUF347)